MRRRKVLRIDAPPGSRIVIEIPPDPVPPDRPLSACEADILETIGDRTLSRAEIVADLCAGPHAHGESTVEHALTRLVKSGRLQKGPKGVGYLRPA